MKMTEKQRQMVLTNLTEKRRIHTLGVLEAADKLCDRFLDDERDREKIRDAIICHDMCRGFEQEKLDKLIEKYDIDSRYKGNANLAHSKIAAAVMKDEFGLDNKELLDAVSYHTTGRAGMSMIEMIVFLADAIEAGRDYPGVDALRELAETDIEKACLLSLEGTISFLDEQGQTIDEDTIKARNWFKERGI